MLTGRDQVVIVVTAAPGRAALLLHREVDPAEVACRRLIARGHLESEDLPENNTLFVDDPGGETERPTRIAPARCGRRCLDVDTGDPQHTTEHPWICLVAVDSDRVVAVFRRRNRDVPCIDATIVLVRIAARERRGVTRPLR